MEKKEQMCIRDSSKGGVTMDLKAVGQRIKAAREAKNLTQEELAALVNLSPTHVSLSLIHILKNVK